MTSGSKRWSSRTVVAGLVAGGCLVALGIAAGVGLIGGVRPRPSQAGHPLDPYPGFGRSPSAALRDDAIGLWEAFRREVNIQSCMEGAGFSYAVDVASPDPSLLKVAHELGVELSEPADPHLSDANSAVRSGLAPGELNRYFLTLNGETSQAMADFEHSGGFTSKDDFAKGGCVGRSWAEVGSIWALRHELENDLTDLRRAETSQARIEYRTCARSFGVAADSPGALEALVEDLPEGAPRADELREAYSRCSTVWSAATRRADRELSKKFVADHSLVLERARDRYAGAFQALKEDRSFREYLGQAGGRFQARPASDVGG